MNWKNIEGLDGVESPGLLVDSDKIQQNIDRMIEIVGGAEHVDRLFPHVKTHKMPEVTRMQVDAGITKFKAATLSEAQMAAGAGASEVLIAHQLVGPKLDRLATLIEDFPNTKFAVLTDDPQAADAINEKCGDADSPLDVYIDIDCGMHRTGIPLGARSDALRAHIDSLSGLNFAGLHVYDGHLHDPDLQQRTDKVKEILGKVALHEKEHPSPRIIVGGSPTFGIWAAETSWHLSPGTTLLWDFGYGDAHPDLPMTIAAALISRVISKPGEGKICIDLGHKSIAAEMPLEKRFQFPDLPDAQPIGQSEEHLVLQTANAASLHVGDIVIAIPRHICPTVALHSHATVVSGGRVTGDRWQVTARDR
ncbi:D-TA family PLP-dependent enzyme [Rosistilla oblonga]|uniref:D-threonine aldolase n=1 Tax=Rosistilla oblonga TaxID=2527990 RepID=A0A518IYA6_9BACT|nr:D-TA family PLP-dependent enzyme [Rosistilla oblonga]QDV58054.1 D-threonine aldolase [Rosistilla oblonga]